MSTWSTSQYLENGLKITIVGGDNSHVRSLTSQQHKVLIAKTIWRFGADSLLFRVVWNTLCPLVFPYWRHSLPWWAAMIAVGQLYAYEYLRGVVERIEVARGQNTFFEE